MDTTEKEDDIQTLMNDDSLKSTLNNAVKDYRDRFSIYLNINNLHFKTSFKPGIFEDISEEPLPTSGPT